MTEAEAKAKKIKVVKVQKVLTSNKATAPFLDFTEGQKPAEGSLSPDKKLKAVGKAITAAVKIKPTEGSFIEGDKKAAKSVRDSRSGPVQKEAAKAAEIDKDADPATDPIAACLNERLKAGGINNNLVEAEAKKKKIQFPVPLKLKVADAKLLELVKDPETSNGKGVSPKPEIKPKANVDKIHKKVSAKPEEKKVAPKDEAPDPSDPIDFALWHRK